MVFQNYALYPHMTVFDNMAFGLKLRKLPAKLTRSSHRVDHAAADTLGLGVRSRPQSPRSSPAANGSASRLAERSFAKPSVFLFDEPLSNLDAKLRVQTRTEISKLHS